MAFNLLVDTLCSFVSAARLFLRLSFYCYIFFCYSLSMLIDYLLEFVSLSRSFLYFFYLSWHWLLIFVTCSSSSLFLVLSLLTLAVCFLFSLSRYSHLAINSPMVLSFDLDYLSILCLILSFSWNCIFYFKAFIKVLSCDWDFFALVAVGKSFYLLSVSPEIKCEFSHTNDKSITFIIKNNYSNQTTSQIIVLIYFCLS